MPDILYQTSKRIVDFTAAFFGILFLIPLFLIAAILIKLDSPGPIFFIQRRCGKDGKEFGMYKFRSMVKDAHLMRPLLQNEVEGSVFKIKDDPRVTRIGKLFRQTSIDELPQLLNVLRGEMSLVGPRPLAADEMTANENWRELRLRVKPGITGLWQVMGRGNREFSEWIQYDTEYVMNRSFLLDIKILLMTFRAVLRRSGAY